jgi:Fe-S oxidoreductase
VLRNRRLFHALLRSAAHLQKPITDSRGSIRHLPLHFSSLTEWRTLPSIADKPLRDLMPAIEDQLSAPRLRVVLFAGCATDFVHPRIGLSLVTVLNRCNIAVTLPQGQSCCGIPALYSGDRQTAVELARQNVRELLVDNPDAVITTCPTCTAALRQHFVDLLKDDADYAEPARQLAALTYDAAAFIAEQLPPLPATTSRGTVTYHDSCHLKRGCGVWKEPRQLLARAGWELREMDRADRCCGFGGSYSFASHPEISREITKDKVNSILRSGADAVAVDCPGCLIMLRGALEKRGLPQRVAHTLEFICEALDEADADQK